jgi:D-glycero-alpha-D-manno-heptose-7-phosphate kinase
MIVSKAPVRITLGGGGTDLPSFYEKFGAKFISASIDKYIYISINSGYKKGWNLRYSENQYLKHKVYSDVEHLLIREVFEYFSLSNDLELIVSSDVPPNSGLGSSGAFLVSLVGAVSHLVGKKLHKEAVAEIACEIEIDRLSRPVGKQDQYISAIGGVKNFIINKNGKVEYSSLINNELLVEFLNKFSRMYFYGNQRDAGAILSEQNKLNGNTEELLCKIKENCNYLEEIIRQGSYDQISNAFNIHWNIKKQLSDNNDQNFLMQEQPKSQTPGS